MMRAYFVTALLFGILYTNGQVNDTPGGNLGFRFTTERGRCPEIEAYLIPDNKTLYEGRWYFIEVGFVTEQARNFRCMAWDSYFDKTGVLHNWLYAFEGRQYKTLRTRLTPIPNKHGMYSLDAGIDTKDKIISTLYYMDTEIFVFWEVTCKADGSHHRSTVVGIRNLNYLYRDKGDQIDRVLTHLRNEGGINRDRTRVRHDENCRYPRPTRNPYN